MRKRKLNILNDNKMDNKKGKKPNLLDDSVSASEQTQPTQPAVTPANGDGVQPQQPTATTATDTSSLITGDQSSTLSAQAGTENQAQNTVQTAGEYASPAFSQSSESEEKAIAELAKKLGVKGSENTASNFNPFAGDVKARGEHAEVKTDPSIKEEIKEFVPPSNILPPPPTQPTNPTPPPPVNPELAGMSPDQTREAAEGMVDVIFDMYGLIKKFIGNKVKIDVAGKKITELVKAGNLSLDMPMPLPDGTQTTFREIVASFDAQVEETFEVSKSFIDKVREPMIQEFQKRGIGLTNIQRIGVYWTIELIQTGMQAFQFKSVQNQIIANQIEVHKMLMNQMGNPAPAQQQTTNTPNQKETTKDDGIQEAEMLEPEEKQ